MPLRRALVTAGPPTAGWRCATAAALGGLAFWTPGLASDDDNAPVNNDHLPATFRHSNRRTVPAAGLRCLARTAGVHLFPGTATAALRRISPFRDASSRCATMPTCSPSKVGAISPATIRVVAVVVNGGVLGWVFRWSADDISNHFVAIARVASLGDTWKSCPSQLQRWLGLTDGNVPLHFM